MAFSIGDRVEFADPHQVRWQGGEGIIKGLPTSTSDQYKVHIITLPPTNEAWTVGDFMWDVEKNLKLISTQPKEAVDDPDRYGGETRTTSATGAEKGVKPARFGLIPSEALTKVAEHYGKGAEKYAAHNWRKGYEWSKSYDALQRHANAFWQGEDNDPEFGTPHMAAVAFHALTLLTFMEEQQSFDDRFKQLEEAQ